MSHGTLIGFDVLRCTADVDKNIFRFAYRFTLHHHALSTFCYMRGIADAMPPSPSLRLMPGFPFSTRTALIACHFLKHIDAAKDDDYAFAGSAWTFDAT